jgi:peptidoglycan/LPS O-acetylase OafA/YrhL
MASGRIPRVAALDGLRGLAVAVVVLFHAGHLRGGYLGVDVFFVLSGYLITSLLLAEAAATGTVGLGGFWSRRARRLFPALAAVLLAVAAYAAVLAQRDELAQLRGDALATIAYVANWRAVFTGQDYWALFRSPSPLAHTWSLAIEEQFYIVWPLAFVGLAAWFRARVARAVLLVSLVLVAASAVLTATLYRVDDPSRAYYGTDTRAAAILLGAALAALVAWRPIANSRAGRVVLECAGLVGLAVLTVACVTLDGRDPALYRGLGLLCALGTAAVIASVAHPRPLLIARVLRARVLVVLGLLSYGIYLWHWPVQVVVTPARANLRGWPLVALWCAITLAVATASFWLLERPIRRGLGAPARWRLAGIATAGLLVVVTLAATARASGPPGSSRVTERLHRAVVRAHRAPDTRRLLVVGDSVGWYLGDAMPHEAAGRPLLVANLSLLACVLPSGASAVTYTRTQDTRVTPPACDRNWSEALDRFRPDTVVLLSWADGDLEYEFGGRRVAPCSSTLRRRYGAELRRFVARVRAAGARPAIATYPPSPLDASSAAARRQVACLNRVRRSVGAGVVELARHYCPRGRPCVATVGGAPLRPDGVHFKGPGALDAAAWVVAQLWPTGGAAAPT